MKFTHEQLAEKKQEIVEQLNLKTKLVNLSPKQTSEITCTSVNTLAVWRSNGRYNLNYVKVSRRIAYPLVSVAKFLLEREVNHTGEAIE